MSRHHDTIAALATPLGSSAIALLRASGPQVRELVRGLFAEELQPRVATHLDYRDAAGVLVDDVVATFFAGPRSYTGEDSLELSCHGNPYIAQRILEDLFKRGCRPAEAGEFTQRAFLGGRMDLSQAEAVMDIIHARSERALAAAQQQLRGALGRRMEVLIEELLGAVARVEAYIDFPEEDLPAEDKGRVDAMLAKCEQGLAQLLASNHYGELLRNGIKTVIVGEPNAGKSSLLNRLVGSERAIVSPEPGTTRDFIEEGILLGDHYLRLIDTAGLNPAPQALERLGIQKTLERGQEADLFLWVVDPTCSLGPLPEELLRRMTPGNTLLVLNKADLGAPSPTLPERPQGLTALQVSALTGEGFEELRTRIGAIADAFQVQVGGEMLAINARHADALGRAKASLGKARQQLATRAPVELMASELREALAACGEISGKIDNERMLDHLFASFCIGK
jgi:tRNA modification GTPase